jgi:hypothetical protein
MTLPTLALTIAVLLVVIVKAQELRALAVVLTGGHAGPALVWMGPLPPRAIARVVVLVAERQAIVTPRHRYVPNRLTVKLHPRDYDPLGTLRSQIASEIGEVLRSHMSAKGLSSVGKPEVRLERAGSARPGVPVIEAGVESATQVDATRRQPRATVRMAQLLITRSGRPLGEHMLDEGTHVVGRGRRAHVRIEDGYISNEHARITVGAGGVVICDLRSTNGTRVNGRPIKAEQRLADGDRVQLGGDVELLVLGATLTRNGSSHTPVAGTL